MKTLILKARAFMNTLHNRADYLLSLVRYDNVDEEIQAERYETAKIIEEAYELIKEMEDELNLFYIKYMSN